MRGPIKVLAIVGLLLCLVFLLHRNGARRAGSSGGHSGVPAGRRERGGPEYAYPRLDLTPGAINPAVTQDNIGSTICVSGYTSFVRPSRKNSHRLKAVIMAEYGIRGDFRDYELDHFIPLELGGCPDCISNLWPEPYGVALGAKEKDRVENYLHSEVCGGRMTLANAQNAIRADWVAVYDEIGGTPWR